ncbi:MAG: hypothetical protein UU76_C0031G0005 [Parcubacteria group bacterium GW2011_GWC1_41_7]|nr:MAG: hypothetical protein UU76_C0031G0005 [Parcubacteria group bacterium GW2011_GWC1_41_7]
MAVMVAACRREDDLHVHAGSDAELRGLLHPGAVREDDGLGEPLPDLRPLGREELPERHVIPLVIREGKDARAVVGVDRLVAEALALPRRESHDAEALRNRYLLPVLDVVDGEKRVRFRSLLRSRAGTGAPSPKGKAGQEDEERNSEDAHDGSHLVFPLSP